jgi:hypothetical protein
MILKAKGIALVLAGLAALTGASAQASAASCEVPLRNVLVDAADCAYYVTAFRMMATHKISVDAVCTRGSFASPQGTQYGAKIATTLTIQDSSCNVLKPFALNPVLLSRPGCVNLKTVIGMLGTEFVDVRPACQYGKWTGADGNPRTSMVATRMNLRQRIAQK